MRIVFYLLFFLGSTGALAPPEQTRREYFGDSLAVASALGLGATVAPSSVRAESFPKTVERISQAFPGALSNKKLLERVTVRLVRFGFFAENTLVASSFCSDEVNRPLEDTFLQYYGNNFAMGGLAGFPFSGVTGFGAMASHIPDGGRCLLVYGPHVGVNMEGDVGTVNRRGVEKTSTCCGSAVAASRYLKQVVNGEAEPIGPPTNPLDAQQAYVSSMLLPFGSEVVNAEEPMVTLPYATYKPIDNMMNRIVAKASSKVGPKGQIGMLGGLQINTPVGMTDFFLPLRFDVRNSENAIVEDLLETITYS